jgi:hypothetical protein
LPSESIARAVSIGVALLDALNVIRNPLAIFSGAGTRLLNRIGIRVERTAWPAPLLPILDRVPFLRDNVALYYVGAAYAYAQALAGVITSYIGIISRPTIRELERDSLNQIPSVADLLNLAVANVPLRDRQGQPQDPRKLAEDWGLPGNYFDALFAATGQAPSIGQLLDLVNRQDGGEIRGERRYTVEYAEQALKETALKDKFIPDLLELRYSLLAASDVVRLAVKDAFTRDPNLLAVLDADRPPEIVSKLLALGYAEDDAKALWRAHWDLPSPTQVYTMLQRQLIAPEVVADYLRAADYDPRWRDLLIAISYDPITRTDAKRAFKIKAPGWDYDRLVKAYRDVGYSEADARLLADFTAQDVGEEARQERELLVGPVRTQALSMYKARRIDEATLRGVLANLKYPSDIVDRYVADIEFSREAEAREEVAEALKGAYVKGLRTYDDTRAMLIANGWTGEAADEVLGPWSILRTTSELTDAQRAERDLTRADVVGAYTDGIIEADEARQLIDALGYDAREAELIVGRATAARERKAQDELIEVAHQRYLAGQLDVAGANRALDEARVGANRKYILINRWDAEREQRIKDLPLGTIEQLVRSGLVNDEEADSLLRRAGYDAFTRGRLFLYWRGRRLSAAEKARASAQGG